MGGANSIGEVDAMTANMAMTGIGISVEANNPGRVRARISALRPPMR